MAPSHNPFQAPFQAGAPSPGALAAQALADPGLPVILAGCVAVLTWLCLILTFFGDSTETWPGWACAVPAIVPIGLAARSWRRHAPTGTWGRLVHAARFVAGIWVGFVLGVFLCVFGAVVVVDLS